MLRTIKLITLFLLIIYGDFFSDTWQPVRRSSRRLWTWCRRSPPHTVYWFTIEIPVTAAPYESGRLLTDIIFSPVSTVVMRQDWPLVFPLSLTRASFDSHVTALRNCITPQSVFQSHCDTHLLMPVNVLHACFVQFRFSLFPRTPISHP